MASRRGIDLDPRKPSDAAGVPARAVQRAVSPVVGAVAAVTSVAAELASRKSHRAPFGLERRRGRRLWVPAEGHVRHKLRSGERRRIRRAQLRGDAGCTDDDNHDDIRPVRPRRRSGDDNDGHDAADTGTSDGEVHRLNANAGPTPMMPPASLGIQRPTKNLTTLRRLVWRRLPNAVRVRASQPSRDRGPRRGGRSQRTSANDPDRAMGARWNRRAFRTSSLQRSRGLSSGGVHRLRWHREGCSELRWHGEGYSEPPPARRLRTGLGLRGQMARTRPARQLSLLIQAHRSLTDRLARIAPC